MSPGSPFNIMVKGLLFVKEKLESLSHIHMISTSFELIISALYKCVIILKILEYHDLKLSVPLIVILILFSFLNFNFCNLFKLINIFLFIIFLFIESFKKLVPERKS